MMDDSSTTSSPRSFTCPACEAGGLRAVGRDSSRCDACGALISGSVLGVLREINDLPDAAGHHACECGHPEMRCLPDGVYWCPSCRAEVLPVRAPSVPWDSASQSEAYWAGWMDGRFKAPESFATNRSLAAWEKASDRLDYYRGHRAGHEARILKTRKASLLRAS